MNQEAIQWRDSMRSPKLYFIDVRLLVVLLVWVLWPRLVTFVPACIAILFLVIAGYRGYRPGAAFRAIRRALVGSPRALSPRRYRRRVDYGVLAAAGVLVLASSTARVEAEFLYIPPETDELQTLAMAGSTHENGALVQVLVGEDATVAMQVPKGLLPAAEATGEEDPQAAQATAALSPEARESAVGVMAIAESGWEVSAGSMLAQVLRQWGERAEVEIVMLTDREYEIGSSHLYSGAFVDAVRALLFGLGDLQYAPVGQVLDGGKVLAVYHRVPEGRGEES